MTRYEQICKLINEEINETIAEDFEAVDDKESIRDGLIADYCEFLKKDLVSDNY